MEGPMPSSCHLVSIHMLGNRPGRTSMLILKLTTPVSGKTDPLTTEATSDSRLTLHKLLKGYLQGHTVSLYCSHITC